MQKIQRFKIILMVFCFISVKKIKEQKEKILQSNVKSLNWTIIINEFKELAFKYEYLIKNETKIPENSPIWVMWYQGIEKAPPIVKSCIKSIIINAGKHPVIILDKNNYGKYITLPCFLLKKFYKGFFSITHFTDILRMGLLLKHGGYWIDSTYFIIHPILPINSSLFTLKLTHCYPTITQCLWAGNFLATPKNSFLATYSYNSFLFYWNKYNSLIDYFLIDYIIYIAYQNVPIFKNLIKNLPYISCDIFSLVNSLNKDYNKSLINCPFNKLNRNDQWKTQNNSTKTIYGHIIDNYKLN